MSEIVIEPVTATLGARLHVVPERLLDDGVAEQCLAALNQYGVIVFPQLGASDETQVAFSNKLGRMEAASKTAEPSKASELGIYVVSLDPSVAVKHRDYIEANIHWHMDGTSYDVPPKATTLKCERPASSGGDTEFANLFAAYEALPEASKRELAELRVVHSLEAANRKMKPNPTDEELARWNATFPPREHKLVWTQRDGRSSLVIGSTADHIVGWPRDKGYQFLQELLAWCTQERFCYRHQWQPGDLVIWNNPGLLHRAHPYTENSGRLMHRTTVMGAEAFC